MNVRSLSLQYLTISGSPHEKASFFFLLYFYSDVHMEDFQQIKHFKDLLYFQFLPLLQSFRVKSGKNLRFAFNPQVPHIMSAERGEFLLILSFQEHGFPPLLVASYNRFIQIGCIAVVFLVNCDGRQLIIFFLSVTPLQYELFFSSVTPLPALTHLLIL